MSTISNEEYADIMMAYGAANGVARAAQRLYQERFPERRLPDRRVFQDTYRRFRETGGVTFNEPRGHIVQHSFEVDERILALFVEDPTRSIRNVAALLQISTWKVWNVLRQNERHPFHYIPVQGLEGGDFEKRVQFCRFLLHTDVDDLDFLKRILWTDESKFTKEGILNLHNMHHWAPKGENPSVKYKRPDVRMYSLK